MPTEQPPSSCNDPGANRAKPRDLADFAVRWGEFRPAAIRIEANSHLSDDDKALLRWLIELADRAGPRDLI